MSQANTQTLVIIRSTCNKLAAGATVKNDRELEIVAALRDEEDISGVSTKPTK